MHRQNLRMCTESKKYMPWRSPPCPSLPLLLDSAMNQFTRVMPRSIIFCLRLRITHEIAMTTTPSSESIAPYHCHVTAKLSARCFPGPKTFRSFRVCPWRNRPRHWRPDTVHIALFVITEGGIGHGIFVPAEIAFRNWFPSALSAS